MKYILLTFGGGHQTFVDAVKRLCQQASEFNIFDQIIGFTDDDLKKDEYFWEKHRAIIHNNRRGYGCYIWKSYLIRKIMEQPNINDGDIILFVDAGCEMNYNETSLKRLYEYFEIANREGMLAFQINTLEKSYSKTDLMKFMGLSFEDMNSGQIESGIFFIKKNVQNLSFLNELVMLNEIRKYKFIDDSPSIEPNDPSFVENRHDQSCLSVLMKKYKKFVLPQENYHHPNWEKALHLPIWTCRTRNGDSIIEKYKNKLLNKPKIAFLIPMTSKGKKWTDLDETNLLNMTLKTLDQTRDPDFDYIFYLGIDEDDPFFSNQEILNKLFSYFVKKKIGCKIYSLTLPKGYLTAMWNLLYYCAYQDECQYFYQASDDIHFVTKNWIKDSVQILKDNNDIGVSGPNNGAPEEQILHNAMISRKHFEIFGYLFPDSIINQNCNNWLSNVYSPKYLFKLNHHYAPSLGGEPKYTPVNDEQIYKMELEKGLQKISIL